MRKPVICRVQGKKKLEAAGPYWQHYAKWQRTLFKPSDYYLNYAFVYSNPQLHRQFPALVS
jgi:hypothetical protein